MAEAMTEPDYDKQPFPVEMDDEDITSEGTISKAGRNVPKSPVQSRNQKFRMLPSPIVQGQRRSGIKEILTMENSSSPLNCIPPIGCQNAGLQLPKRMMVCFSNQ